VAGCVGEWDCGWILVRCIRGCRQEDVGEGKVGEARASSGELPERVGFAWLVARANPWEGLPLITASHAEKTSAYWTCRSAGC
jgi:hypothetical protein